MRLLTWFLSAAATCALGCGSVTATFTPLPDAGDQPDAAQPDAGIDAPIDATDAAPTPPPPPGTARELPVVGGAVADSRFHFEVEVTGGFVPQRTGNATHRLDSAITVTVPPGGN